MTGIWIRYNDGYTKYPNMQLFIGFFVEGKKLMGRPQTGGDTQSNVLLKKCTDEAEALSIFQALVSTLESSQSQTPIFTIPA